MSKKTQSNLAEIKKILTTLGQDEVYKGSQAKIYRKYVHLLIEFLKIGAKHDIDNNGILWCEKKEWVAWLSPQISDNDGNAIGYIHCCKPDKETRSAKTAGQIGDLIKQGKEYICHRMYNMQFVKNLERRKIGRNVAYFRFLQLDEKPTPPCRDSVTMLKSIFKEKGKLQDKIYVLDLNKVCDELITSLPQNFNTEADKLKEWQRVISRLEQQNLVRLVQGSYEFNENGW